MERKYEARCIESSNLFDYQTLAATENFMQRAECVWMSEAQVLLWHGCDEGEELEYDVEVRQVILAGVNYAKVDYAPEHTYLIIIENNAPTRYAQYTSVIDFDYSMGVQYILKKQTPWSAIAARLNKSTTRRKSKKSVNIESSLTEILGDTIKRDNTADLTCRLGTLNGEAIFYHDGNFYPRNATPEGEFLIDDEYRVDFDDFAEEPITLEVTMTKLSLVPTLKVIKESWAEDATIYLGADLKLPWKACYKVDCPEWRDLCAQVENFWFLHDYDSETISIGAPADRVIVDEKVEEKN